MNEIFSILSSGRARTNVILAGNCGLRRQSATSVILAGKRGSRRHSTRSFKANVVVAGTRYQMLEVLSFCDGRARNLLL